MLPHAMGHQLLGRRAAIPRGLRLLLCRLASSHKPRSYVRDCYKLLELEEGCSLEEVRSSYRSLAKKYHPDSSAGTADPAAFIRVEEAYRAVLSHVAARQHPAEEGEEEEDQFKAKSLQHRHYLSFEGVGIGTPSQREKQYMQFRVDRATEQVLEYRQQRLGGCCAGTDLLRAKDLRESKKVRITQAVERLVEDLIQESMAKGDFDNLSGKGKPLRKFSDAPHIDPMTHNLNRILIDNGYQPEWILLQKEIRETIERLREGAVAARRKLGEPMSPPEREQWGRVCEQFMQDIRKLNKRVDNFNLVVPILSRQLVHFSPEREIVRAQKSYEALRAEGSQSDTEGGKEDGKRFGWKASLFKWLSLTPK